MCDRLRHRHLRHRRWYAYRAIAKTGALSSFALRPHALMGLPVRARGFSWRHADRDAAAIGPLDLDIAAGEKVLLLGPSGAGKSTLLHAIAGVLPVEAGESTGEILIGDDAPDPRRGVTGSSSRTPIRR